MSMGVFIIGGICAKHWGGPVVVPIRSDPPEETPCPVSTVLRPSESKAKLP